MAESTDICQNAKGSCRRSNADNLGRPPSPGCDAMMRHHRRSSRWTTDERPRQQDCDCLPRWSSACNLARPPSPSCEVMLGRHYRVTSAERPGCRHRRTTLRLRPPAAVLGGVGGLRQPLSEQRLPEDGGKARKQSHGLYSS